MLKQKGKCPVCGAELKYYAISGKIEKTCEHNLRIKPKRNAWISNIFSFVCVIYLLPDLEVKDSLTQIEKIGIQFLYIFVAFAIALIILSVLYKLFGFENLYKIEERNYPKNTRNP